MLLSCPKPLRQQRFVLVVLKCCFYGLWPHSLYAPIPVVCIHVSDGMGKVDAGDEFSHIQFIGTDDIFSRSEGSLREY